MLRPRRNRRQSRFREPRGPKRQGLSGDAPSGAVTFVQRFGSSVNLNVDLHTMVLDGVFTREAQGPPALHCGPPPSYEELDEVVRRVHRRAVASLD